MTEFTHPTRRKTSATSSSATTSSSSAAATPQNMLAVWRVHGFDTIAREAWEEGLVLAGSSGGMHGWFEACVTDSFGPQLQGMRGGLGFLPGSACAHFDDEESRRPFYHQLVDHEPAGYAADWGVGLASSERNWTRSSQLVRTARVHTSSNWAAKRPSIHAF
jgi:peptidase E